MSQEKVMELRAQLSSLERRIRPLEWDASRKQINEFRKQQLEQLKAEHINLSEELRKLLE